MTPRGCRAAGLMRQAAEDREFQPASGMNGEPPKSLRNAAWTERMHRRAEATREVLPAVHTRQLGTRERLEVGERLGRRGTQNWRLEHGEPINSDQWRTSKWRHSKHFGLS